MISGMLDAEKIWHENLTDLSTSPDRCSHFTFRYRGQMPFLSSNSIKKSFLTLLFICCRLFTFPQKKTNSNCCTAALAVYLLLFSASYDLHSPSTASGACYRRSTYWYGHVEACGSGLLWHGLNFSTAWCTMRLISVKKDWKHVVQKLVTLNTCCDIACLTFQLPHITTVLFRATDDNP